MNFKKKKKIVSFLKETLSSIFIVILVSSIILYFFSIAVVDGHSMDPTLYDSEKLLLFQKAYSLNKEPERGDIIVIKKKVEDGDYIIKRVIGESGDELKIENDEVYINGKLINEPYIYEPMVNNEYINIIIPDGYVFVMGDNRNKSLDSRSSDIGLVNITNEIVGKAIFSISDFSKIE